MIKNLVTATLLATMPFNVNNTSNKEQTTSLEYVQTAEWVVNQTATTYVKNQVKKVEPYNYGALKIETIQCNQFYQNTQEQKQELRSYTITKLTFNQETSYTTFQFKGNKLYLDDITATGKTYERVLKVNTNPDIWNNYFNQIYYATNYQEETLQDLHNAIPGYKQYATTEIAIDMYNNYKASESYTPGDVQEVILLEYLYYNNNYYEDSATYGEYVYLNKDTNFFVASPTTLTITQEYQITNIPQDGSYEVVDVGGLMLTILGMPLAWISQAFNFTFWEATPYAINVGHVLGAIIFALLVIIIIRKIAR